MFCNGAIGGLGLTISDLGTCNSMWESPLETEQRHRQVNEPDNRQQLDSGWGKRLVSQAVKEAWKGRIVLSDLQNSVNIVLK